MIQLTTAPAARLRCGDLARISSAGIRTRKVRAALSALGIAIGVAAIVAVLGLAASSQAGLLAEIDQLGTNLLTVTNGQTLFGQPAELPGTATAMIGRLPAVRDVQSTGTVHANVYRSDLIPAIDTNALSVEAASLNLLPAIGATLAHGRFLNAATAGQPVAVLGAAAAQRLGLAEVHPGERILIGGQWFYVAGILGPAVLAPAVDNSVLVGFPAAKAYLGFDGHPSTVYVRTGPDQVAQVYSRLAGAASPQAPNEVDVSRPSTGCSSA
jgi:putative ABC transport system permease protein